MSRYQILKNINDCNNDDESTATTLSLPVYGNENTNMNAAKVIKNDENFSILRREHHSHLTTHHVQDKYENTTTLQHKYYNHHNFCNHYYDGDDDGDDYGGDGKDDDRHTHNLNDMEFLISDNHVKDLIQYDANHTQSIYKKKDNNTTTDNDILKNNKRNKIINSKTHNLMTPLNSAFAGAAKASAVVAFDVTADNNTMEIPLLQQNCNNNTNRACSRNYNNNNYQFQCNCLCQQKGFASNLNSNSTQTAKSKIFWAIVLCCVFMIVEFLGGYIAGSLAIMTDAAHLASDCISFIIGLVAIWLGSRPPDAKMSFGYKRFEVMGAIVSILGIWILTITLGLVAIQRIYLNDYDLDANTMMTISGIGILINIIMIFILHTSVLDLPAGSIGSSHGHSHSHNLNHRGHNNSHSHSHIHCNSNSGSHMPSPILYRRHSNDNGQLLTTEFSSSRMLPTDNNVYGNVGIAATAAIDTGEVTSIELSSGPMVTNEGLQKRQQDGRDKNLNLRAAMIHVIGDLVQSFGVFLASVLIKIFPKAVFLDPLCTLLFSVIVIMTTINLFKESIYLIMDSVPKGISLEDLEMDLLNIEGVKSVHHLNVWNHTSNYSILMVHLVIDITDSNTILLKASQIAGSAKYDIKHSTIQIELASS